MAVLVQKTWNDTAGVIPEGVDVRFSSNGSYLYVLNAKGLRIAQFRSEEVKNYWIETNPISSLTGTIT
jgi:hypothetical protein